MKRILVPLCFFLVLLSILGLFWIQHSVREDRICRDTVALGDTTIFVNIADTLIARTHGLSDTLSLASSTGLLFVFDAPGRYGFWMKDMHYPIDIIWIDDTLHVAGIERNVRPESYPKVFTPPTQIRYVLETNVGVVSSSTLARKDPIVLTRCAHP